MLVSMFTFMSFNDCAELKVLYKFLKRLYQVISKKKKKKKNVKNVFSLYFEKTSHIFLYDNRKCN